MLKSFLKAHLYLAEVPYLYFYITQQFCISLQCKVTIPKVGCVRPRKIPIFLQGMPQERANILSSMPLYGFPKQGGRTVELLGLHRQKSLGNQMFRRLPFQSHSRIAKMMGDVRIVRRQLGCPGIPSDGRPDVASQVEQMPELKRNVGLFRQQAQRSEIGGLCRVQIT